MSRPASSRLPIRPRTPAHEHAVRDLRLARATIERLRGDLETAGAVTALHARKFEELTAATRKQTAEIEDKLFVLAQQHEAITARAEKAEQESKSIQGLNDLLIEARDTPIPMRIPCPRCGALHVDEGEWATRPHSTHTCQHCGECFKPCLHPTVGVRFLPGTRNETR